MTREQFNKQEKAILRRLCGQEVDVEKMEQSYALSCLIERRFVETRRYTQAGKVRYGLTQKGINYLKENPDLKDPFPIEWIIRVATIIAAVAATAALFVGCIRLLAMR